MVTDHEHRGLMDAYEKLHDQNKKLKYVLGDIANYIEAIADISDEFQGLVKAGKEKVKAINKLIDYDLHR